MVQIDAAVQSHMWTDVRSYLREWFHEPDTEALAIALAACRAQAYTGCLPVWLFVVGPASTGKTSIVMEACSEFPLAREVGDLTPRTFLSGKKGAPSLLFEGGRNHLFLFKDFTTFLSKRPEDRAAIAGQLREIYDGRWTKDTGEIGAQPWQGRVTVIAASTHALEHHWALHRNLGERFLTVRWPEGDPLKQAECAEKQVGHYPEIRESIHKLIKQFLEPVLKSPPPAFKITQCQEIESLGPLIARARVHVSRSESHDKITEVFPAEGPSRIVQAIHTLAFAHAELMGSPEIDLGLVRRVAFDSIPWRREQVLRVLPNDDLGLRFEQIEEATDIPRSSLQRTLEDMEAARLIEHHQTDGAHWYSLKPVVIKWLQQAGWDLPKLC